MATITVQVARVDSFCFGEFLHLVLPFIQVQAPFIPFHSPWNMYSVLHSGNTEIEFKSTIHGLRGFPFQ